MALTKVTYSMIDGAYVNVQDRGVKADGVTNDTIAIQQALRDFAGINPVFFPPGTYLVDGDAVLPGNATKEGIQIPSNSTLIFAEGAEIQLITTTSPQYNVLCVYNVSNVKIFGGKLIGDTDNHPPGVLGSNFNGIGLRIQGATNVYVNGMSAEKMYADGFAIVYDDVNAPYPECVNVVLENCTSTYNYRNGLSVIGCEDGAVIGGTYANNGQATQAGIGTGIDIEPNPTSPSLPDPAYVKKYLVTNASIHDNRTTGLQVYGAGTLPNQGIADDISLQNNRLWGNASNIGTYQATNVLICGNTLNDNTASGISINSCKRVVADGNTVSNAGLHGVIVQASGVGFASEDIEICNNSISESTLYGIVVGPASRVAIQNNIVSASSQAGDNTYDNIQIDDTDYTTISGNTVYRGDGAAQARYGINVVSTSAGNMVYGHMVFQGGKTRNIINTGVSNKFFDNKISQSFTVSTLFVNVYQYASSGAVANSISLTVYGTDGTNAFQDELVFGSASGDAVVVVSASTIKGAPGTRNYSTTVFSNALAMFMSAGSYTVIVEGSER
jgi:parallel beta-helix repeat protein